MQTKICEFCGETFVPNSGMQRYCKRPHYMQCPVCGKVYLVTNNENLKRPPVACSYDCRKARREQTSMKKYGIKAPGNNPEARLKAKKTMQEKYGVDYAMQSDELRIKATKTIKQKYGVDSAAQSKEVRQKIERTCVSKYGSTCYLTSNEGIAKCRRIMQDKYNVNYPLQSEVIKDKFKATCRLKYGSDWFTQSDIGKNKIKEAVRSKYGVDYIIQLESIRRKSKQTCMARYGVDNPSKSQEIKDKIAESMITKYGVRGSLSVPEIRNKIMQTSMDKYGVPFYVMLDDIRKSSGSISKINKAFKEKLNNAGIEYDFEFRIDNRSFDIIIPSIQTLLEINPSYTHNIIGNHWNDKGLELGYHQNKCKLAHDHQFNSICVFDWDNSDQLVEELSAPAFSIPESAATYVLKRKSGSEFLSKYGRSRLSQYPRKSMFVGLVHEGQIQMAAVLTSNMSPIECSYQIIDYGWRWGLECNTSMYALLQSFRSMIDISDICVTVDADRLRLSDLDSFCADTSSLTYSQPDIYWSKSRYRTPYSDSNRNLLDEGWLPVEDCGYIMFKLKDLGS